MLQADRYGGSFETIRLSPRSDYGGTMHLFERRFRGWKTGIYDGMLILEPSHLLSDFCTQPKGLPEMLGERSVLTLRVFGSSIGNNLPTPDGLLDRETSATVREVLTLAPEYREFLRQLGKHTRRNIQQCRKWASAKAIRVQREPLNSAEVLALAIRNMPTPKHPERILQNIRFTEKQAHPFQLSLIADIGVPFSTAGGFIEGNCAFLIYQANDHRYRQLNPSLMLRSFLIEELIERGVRHLAFVGGCAGVLLHQCEVVKTAELLLVRKTLFSGIKHFAATSLSDETSRVKRLSPQFI
jgi:hypothetical protein